MLTYTTKSNRTVEIDKRNGFYHSCGFVCGDLEELKTLIEEYDTTLPPLPEGFTEAPCAPAKPVPDKVFPVTRPKGSAFIRHRSRSAGIR